MRSPPTKPGILIAVDDVAAFDDLKQQLEKIGYAPLAQVRRGEDAIKLAIQLRPHLVVLDASLAGSIDSIATARAIRAQLSLPVLFLVASTESWGSEHAEPAETFDCIQMPFSTRELKGVIELALYKHEANAKLQQLTERLRLAHLGAVDGAWDWDLNTNELNYSSRWFEILGFRSQELAITPALWRSLTHPDDLPRALQLLKEIFSSDAPSYEYEVRLRHKAGHYLTVLTRGIVVRDATGKALRVVGSTTDLTAQKKMESDLDIQRRFSTQIIDTVLHGLTVTDAEGRFEFVNPAYARMCGCEPAELIGKFPEEVTAPEARAAHAAVRAERRAGKSSSYESRLQRKDGSVVDILISGTPRGQGGQFAGAIAAIADLTEVKKTEEALQARENELLLITNHLPGPLARVDRDLRYLFVNDQYEKIFGRPREQVLGRPLREVIGDAIFDQIAPYVQRALAGETVTFEEHFRASSGGEQFWLLNLIPDLDRHRNVTGIFSIAIDVTERKTAQQALQESETQLNGILESTGDGILAVDQTGSVIRTNQRFAEMWRIPDALLNAGDDVALLDFVLSQLKDPEAFVKKVRELYASAAFDSDTLRFKDGRVFERHSSPLMRDGAIHGRVWSFHDITEREHAEAARVSLESQLRESQKMQAIGTLAGGIAHDFNNIIATILGNTELARQDMSGNPQAIESLDEIKKASSRARDLVQQILSFSRRQPTQLKPISVCRVIEDLVRLLRATLPARITLNVQCDNDVPPVLADATQIEQVVINLCTNAMHAMQGASGRIDMQLDTVALEPELLAMHPALQTLPKGRAIRLTVTDDGAGMDAATQARIFEPFFTTKSVDEGTGLGLSVVHGIVQAHEGAITVQSQPGKGATFTIYLPINQLAPVAITNDAPAASAVSTLSLKKRRRILYLDDDEALVFLVTRLLERRGFQVSGYSDQRGALDALRADPAAFDLVVTDYNMPGMSGLDVAREVRAIRADLPVAIASGFIDETLRAQAAGAGVRELIFKANAAEELCEAFARLALMVENNSHHPS